MRLFIGLALPEAWKDALSEAAEAAGFGRPPWRLAHCETLHLTLAFLGETGLGDLARVRQAMDRVAMAPDSVPVVVETGRWYGFPSRSRARVVVVELRSGQATDGVIRLAGSLEAALVAAGVPIDRKPFRAHVTVARVGKGETDRVDPEARRCPPLAAEIASLTLWESRLERPHAVHVPLHEAPLGRGST